MIAECEASALSDFIFSRFSQRAVPQSYTGRALSECCSVLSELVRELSLSPVVMVSTSRLQDWRHLFQCCQPLFENALQSIIFSPEALSKPIQRTAELQLT